MVNITLICRLKFSDHKITHLSTRPYYVALALLLVQLVEATYWIYLCSIDYQGEITLLVFDIIF